jgi:hypothetical protein
MKRVKFEKNPQGDDSSNEGPQRKFLKDVLVRINCPSLRELINRGFDVSYSTLKNYFSEKRLLPENLFKNLCYVAKIDPSSLNVEYLKENWGQVKGGKKKYLYSFVHKFYNDKEI